MKTVKLYNRYNDTNRPGTTRQFNNTIIEYVPNSTSADICVEKYTERMKRTWRNFKVMKTGCRYKTLEAAVKAIQ